MVRTRALADLRINSTASQALDGFIDGLARSAFSGGWVDENNDLHGAALEECGSEDEKSSDQRENVLIRLSDRNDKQAGAGTDWDCHSPVARRPRSAT